MRSAATHSQNPVAVLHLATIRKRSRVVVHHVPSQVHWGAIRRVAKAVHKAEQWWRQGRAWCVKVRTLSLGVVHLIAHLVHWGAVDEVAVRVPEDGPRKCRAWRVK